MVDTFNALGSTLQQRASNRGLQQVKAGLASKEQAAQDSNFTNEAIRRANASPPDLDGATEAANNIQDNEIRLRVFQLLREKRGKFAAFANATAAFKKDTVGIADPHVLFFMMVFYLNQRSPRINWNDILRSVSSVTDTTFSNLTAGGGEPFPIPRTTAVSTLIIDPTTGKAKTSTDEDAAARNGNRGAAARLERLRKEKQAEVDKLRKEAQATVDKARREAEQRGKKVKQVAEGSAAASVLWPFQNMPTIDSGWTKSVNWDSAKQAVTFAEPILTNDGGASAIEFDILLQYGVGLQGMGSDILPWTTEQILGIIYLASSLVYPFDAHGLISARAKKDEAQPPADDEKAQAQFPVLFMRHHSLFPFLTPFVVKQVTVQPDENQPLIITEPINLPNVNTRLSLPAV